MCTTTNSSTPPLARSAVSTTVCTSADRRYTLFPIVEQDIWYLYKQQLQKFWTHDEIDFSCDAASWATLNEDEQRFVSTTLAFFANSDNIVLENISARFACELTLPEARLFLSLQAAVEGVHVVTYNMCIEAVVHNPSERTTLFKAIEHNPVVQPKTDWARRWATSDHTLAHRLVAFAAVEGIFFASSFASLFWLRLRQKVPGICFANEKIVEDESLHVRFAAAMYRGHTPPLPDDVVYGIVRQAVEIEVAFVRDVLPVRLIGMNSELMVQYVHNVADVILSLLGVPPVYHAKNPFEWMVGIGLAGKSNFFEKRVAEYAKTGDESSIRSDTLTGLGDSLDF